MHKVNNVNVNYLKIPKHHRGSHKMPSRAACLRPWCSQCNARK